MKIKYKTTQLQCGGLVASDLLTLQKSCADLYMHLWTNERIFAMDVFVTACSECNDWHIILQRFWISLLIRQSPWQMSVTYIINICFSWYVRMNFLNFLALVTGKFLMIYICKPMISIDVNLCPMKTGMICLFLSYAFYSFPCLIIATELLNFCKPIICIDAEWHNLSNSNSNCKHSTKVSYTSHITLNINDI